MCEFAVIGKCKVNVANGSYPADGANFFDPPKSQSFFVGLKFFMAGKKYSPRHFSKIARKKVVKVVKVVPPSPTFTAFLGPLPQNLHWAVASSGAVVEL